MEEPTVILEAGTKIKTDKVLMPPSGVMVKQQYIAARRSSALGTIRNWVAGHGGDYYWVEHEDGVIAVYGWMEFELAAGSQARTEEDAIKVATDALLAVGAHEAVEALQRFRDPEYHAEQLARHKRAEADQAHTYFQRTDLFGATYSLQMSSLATEPCVLFGQSPVPIMHASQQGTRELSEEDCERIGLYTTGRMHLTQEMVAGLIPFLQHFVETGELPPEEGGGRG